MRYPKEKPIHCTTIDYPTTGTVYCSTTQQKVVEGTCKACEEHYGVKHDGGQEAVQAPVR